MLKSLEALVVATTVAALIGGVVVTEKRRESKTTVTGTALRRAAAAAIRAAGGEWATLGPGAERRTWKAIVVRGDFSMAVVILNDRLRVVRVIGVRPAHRTPAAGRNLAAGQARSAATNLV